MIAAVSLLDIKNIPSAGLHRLEGKRSDEYAVYLVHPFRLVFKPILKENVNMYELEKIKIIRIQEVTDYHGKQKR